MKKRMVSVGLALVFAAALTACGSRQSAQSTVTVPTESTDFAEQTEESSAEASEVSAEGNSESNGETDEASGGKTLIAYFSLIDIVPEGADASTHATPAIGNTESAAMEIQRQVGGDLFAIQTVEAYPVLHSEASEIAEEELSSDARPELSTHVENMDNYDTIFLGYPIWWYQEPMAIRTFLEEYDFSGKIIVPFCTTLGAGLGESVDNIQSLAPNATVLDGLTLRTARQDSSEEIASWLSEIALAD